MQFLPISSFGVSRVSASSERSTGSAEANDFANILKNSKFMQNSFHSTGQAKAFSDMFARVNSRVNSDLKANSQDFTTQDVAKEDIQRDNFATSTRENITQDSTVDRQVKNPDVRKDVTNEQKDINTDNNNRERTSNKENDNTIDNKQNVSQQAENEQEMTGRAAQERESDKVAQEKERVNTQQSVQAREEKLQDGDREKIARAIDVLQEMGVKREEMEKVLKSLEDVDLQNMQDLEKVVTKLLQEKLENAEVDKYDFSFVQDFLQNLGMNRGEIQNAMDKLRAGKEQEFVKFLNNFLQEQKGNTNIDVQQKDLVKLLKSLDLSDKAKKDIKQSLNALNEENIKRKDLGKMLDMIAKKLDSKSQVQAQNDSNNFSREFVNWLKNHGLSDREINRLEQQIQNNEAKGKTDKNIQQALQNLQAGNREKGEEFSQLKYSGKNSAGQEEKAVLQQTDSGKHAGRSKSSEGSFLQRVQQVKSALESNAGNNNSGSGGKNREGSSAWKEMWGKIKNTSQGTNELGSGQKMQEKANTTMQQILGKNSGSGKLSQNQEMRANVLKQVQNGMLRNLNQGGKELTMRLHPPQLGKLNVTLQVQNQEVSALIKSTSAEVAKVIHNQVAELKHVLEQQGLKVQKLEVQTQTTSQEDASQNWFNQDEHNQAQDRREQSEKRSLINRWLGREEEDEVAQSLQNNMQEEKYSVSEISVIA